MAIDPSKEELIPLKNRSKLGIMRSKERLRVWIEEGFYVKRLGRRFKLEGMYVGNTLCTSKEAINRFLLRTNGRRQSSRRRPPAPQPSPTTHPSEDLAMSKEPKKPAAKKKAAKKATKKAEGKKKSG